MKSARRKSQTSAVRYNHISACLKKPRPPSSTPVLQANPKSKVSSHHTPPAMPGPRPSLPAFVAIACCPPSHPCDDQCLSSATKRGGCPGPTLSAWPGRVGLPRPPACGDGGDGGDRDAGGVEGDGRDGDARGDEEAGGFPAPSSRKERSGCVCVWGDTLHKSRQSHFPGNVSPAM